MVLKKFLNVYKGNKTEIPFAASIINNNKEITDTFSQIVFFNL